MGCSKPDDLELVLISTPTNSNRPLVCSVLPRVAIVAAIFITILGCLLLLMSNISTGSKAKVESPEVGSCCLPQPLATKNWSEYEDVSSQVHGVPDDFYLYKSPDFEEDPAEKSCTPRQDAWKFDCYPNVHVDRGLCEKRGCCWIDAQSSRGVPYCFYPSTYRDYSYVNLTTASNGYNAFLQRTTESGYPGDVKLLQMDIVFETPERLKIKISDPNSQRWEVPLKGGKDVDGNKTERYYDVKFYSPVGFQVVRRSDSAILFDTRVGSLVFSDQFIQISSLLPSTFLYGLGEHQENFLHGFDWQKITLFNADQIPLDGVNIYGSHPFYLMMEGSGKSHGVFLLNSNAMDVVLQPTPAITYRTIGGILEFYFFLGPTPGRVISQYTELIGRPRMPPYWSLGFHLCRFNYGSLERTRAVMQRNIDAGIPVQVQWNDIDYMDKRKDFTVNDKFADLGKFVKELHEFGRRYVPIVDPGIASSYPTGSYAPFDEGVDMDVFVKNAAGENLVGKVWPGDSVWPDFSHPNATKYWTNQLKGFHDKIPFDGLWIDMNDPSNFVDGSVAGCPNSSLENPQFVPNVIGGTLNHKTLCMSAKQYASTHYNLHNLYGNQETEATYSALVEIRGKRPLIISRSTFPGQGNFGGHWTGDIESTWHAMAMTIPGILNFNLFGIPMVGADICGFNGNTTAKLCQRWMALGAFYPFSRNHNTDDGIDQDPVALGPEVVNASINALTMRYDLLPYLYTLFFKAEVYGETVVRPLFFEFPNDRMTYAVDDQFMWGSALMILPVLEEDVVTIKPYFPEGTWFVLSPEERVIESPGAFLELNVSLDQIGLALRGGNVIVTQKLADPTLLSWQEFFTLVVAIRGNEANGEFFWDDGESVGTTADGMNTRVSFAANATSIVSEVLSVPQNNLMPKLNKVTVYGFCCSPLRVSLFGKPVSFSYEQKFQRLDIFDFKVLLMTPLEITWVLA